MTTTMASNRPPKKPPPPNPQRSRKPAPKGKGRAKAPTPEVDNQANQTWQGVTFSDDEPPAYEGKKKRKQRLEAEAEEAMAWATPRPQRCLGNHPTSGTHPGRSKSLPVVSQRPKDGSRRQDCVPKRRDIRGQSADVTLECKLRAIPSAPPRGGALIKCIVESVKAALKPFAV
jgi:hypothetical protein